MLRVGSPVEVFFDGGWWRVEVDRRVKAKGGEYLELHSRSYDLAPGPVPLNSSSLRPRWVLIDGVDAHWLAARRTSLVTGGDGVTHLLERNRDASVASAPEQIVLELELLR